MPAPQIIHTLVARFEDNRSAYRSGKYNEAQLRQEFLDPFFEALGWDIYNKNGYSPEYRDVVIEDSLEIEGGSKAPDYAFKIGKERKFYVEAKKPVVDIRYDIHPAYQLRRYAWNAHLPLSVLTDFEEFAVYNCKNKPNPGDSAATGRDLFFRYTDYIEKWDEIAAIFSRDAVWKGSFDRFADTSKGKKGTTEVDDAFLKDIEAWRTLLARNIALRNPQVLDERQLNYAVQITIDRIIFLRICEDRLIEPENLLLELTHAPGIYSRLVDVFQRADLKYNSGLFHFNTEKGNPSPADGFTPGLIIDDKVLKEIITSLYYPCPYIFKEIPVEILGQVYEQFLGKVIRLTPGRMVKIEEKPEVRKAGGVYYTPRYIVDYIVQNTVGKLLEGKTPAEAAALKIVDPACGSGSFLLGAFQHLLDWHIQWYLGNEPEKWGRGKNPPIMPASGGGWKLTTQKKKEILVNNIHGVDIDAQAVEVTKLSLLLKVLEEESGQLSLGLERALPDLGRNIQCGNSLIGEDYFAGRLAVEEDERRRVNPFEWQHAFPQVFTQGGFDAVIGNPPYSAKQSVETKILTKFYKSIEYKCDPFAFFIEQGLLKLKVRGYLGYIVPVTWMTNFYYMNLRKLLVDTKSLYRLVLLEGLVFKNANVDTCILILEKESRRDNFEWLKTKVANLNNQIQTRPYSLVQNETRYEITPSADEEWIKVRQKIDQKSIRLDSLVKISLGMKLRKNDEFVTRIQDQFHPDGIYFGSDFSRYGFCKPQRFFNYEKAVIIGGTKNQVIHKSKPKILIQAIRNLSLKRRIVAALETEGDYFIGTVNGVTMKTNELDIKYLLGLINSNLVNNYFSKRFTTISLTAAFLGAIPIYQIDFINDVEKMHQINMVALVERMLDLHKRVPATPHEQESLQRQIAATDHEIDALVYELYGLTEEEIKIVEAN